MAQQHKLKVVVQYEENGNEYDCPVKITVDENDTLKSIIQKSENQFKREWDSGSDDEAEFVGVISIKLL